MDGGPRKVGGTLKLNATTLESGSPVRGLFDYWRMGTAGTPVQKRVIHVGEDIYKDDADGTFTSLATGLSATAIPNYNLFDDILIIASDSNIDVPKSWDQTTFQNLAGTPPNFAFSATHKNRVWAAGVASDPSTVYYSEIFDPEDWTGAGSGSIQIDPGDGDKITGLISHNNELFIFKGPHKGSIHRITGSAPTGDDPFARRIFIRGVGAVSQNTIFRFLDDVGFIWSDGSVRSLKATDSFGDFSEAAMSRGIRAYIHRTVDFSSLPKAWVINDDSNATILFGFQSVSGTDNDTVLMMDYRFQPPRWAVWNAFDPSALAVVLDPDNNDLPTVMMGSSDGFVKKMNQDTRSIDGTGAIRYIVTTPFIHYGIPIMMKTLTSASVGLKPRTSSDMTFRWRRDNNASQTKVLTQTGGTDLLAPAPENEFTLGTSTLSGGDFLDIYVDMDEGGEFRSIQYEFSNLTAGDDIELHTFSAVVEGGAWSGEN
jgi:hypothetical protein